MMTRRGYSCTGLGNAMVLHTPPVSIVNRFFWNSDDWSRLQDTTIDAGGHAKRVTDCLSKFDAQLSAHSVIAPCPCLCLLLNGILLHATPHAAFNGKRPIWFHVKHAMTSVGPEGATAGSLMFHVKQNWWSATSRAGNAH